MFLRPGKSLNQQHRKLILKLILPTLSRFFHISMLVVSQVCGASCSGVEALLHLTSIVPLNEVATRDGNLGGAPLLQHGKVRGRVHDHAERSVSHPALAVDDAWAVDREIPRIPNLYPLQSALRVFNPALEQVNPQAALAHCIMTAFSEAVVEDGEDIVGDLSPEEEGVVDPEEGFRGGKLRTGNL